MKRHETALNQKKRTRLTAQLTSKARSDPRFSTDVIKVRMILRTLFRNSPYHDYLRFLNFILESLRLMNSSQENQVTWWHIHEPAFRAIVSPNSYFPYLLDSMGFVKLEEIYVWPAVHLPPTPSTLHTWGRSKLPKNCPGIDEKRLPDMILLFSLLRTEVLANPDFRGHLPTTLEGDEAED